MEEQLSGSCTTEIAAFDEFARLLGDADKTANYDHVIFDTAPTGHTMRLLSLPKSWTTFIEGNTTGTSCLGPLAGLLDAAQAYHKEVLRQSSNMPDSVINLLPRLRDPDFTRILIITLPEATPVHEAERLQEDLARADIHPFAWIINQALSPLQTTNPVLLARQENEKLYIKEVEQLASRVAVVPWLAEAPSDTSGLEKMLGSQPRLTAVL